MQKHVLVRFCLCLLVLSLTLVHSLSKSQLKSEPLVLVLLANQLTSCILSQNYQLTAGPKYFLSFTYAFNCLFVVLTRGWSLLTTDQTLMKRDKKGVLTNLNQFQGTLFSFIFRTSFFSALLIRSSAYTVLRNRHDGSHRFVAVWVITVILRCGGQDSMKSTYIHTYICSSLRRQ